MRKGRWAANNCSACQRRVQKVVLCRPEETGMKHAIVLEDMTRPRRFVTTAVILVDQDEPFTVKDLQKLLEQSVVKLVVPERHEQFDITLDWQGLEELQ